MAGHISKADEDSEVKEAIQRAVSASSKAKGVAVLTGAGLSADSGLPTFRGPDGIWERVSAEEVATLDAIKRDHRRVWEFHLDMRRSVLGARPNAGHEAIAMLESMYKDVWVITQNIDNLHQEAGSTCVVELHGNIFQQRCMDCTRVYTDRSTHYPELPPRCPSCGGELRLNVVFFGEQLPQHALSRAFEWVERCDLLLVVGTSGVVMPAALLPYHAAESGARVIEFNLEPTPITTIATVSVFGRASKTLPQFLTALKGVMD